MLNQTLALIEFDTILDHYCGGTDRVTNLVDLLADAMHWCRVEEVNFRKQLRIARKHFAKECRQLKRKPH